MDGCAEPSTMKFGNHLSIEHNKTSGKVTIEGALSKDQAEAAILDAGFTLAA